MSDKPTLAEWQHVFELISRYAGLVESEFVCSADESKALDAQVAKILSTICRETGYERDEIDPPWGGES